MTSKILLIILVIAIGILALIPFVLNVAGIKILQFGSVSGGISSGGGEILLRSEDAGLNWENSGLTETKRPRFPSQITSFAFHPVNKDEIYLGAKGNGLWKSENGGKSWKKTTDPSGTLDPKADIYKISVGRNGPETIYLAAFQQNRGRVLKSVDGGKSFREIYFVSKNRFGVFDAVLNPADAENVIIGTGQGGVLESKNGGKTWRVIKWFNEPVVKLIPNPAFFGEMFALSSSGKIWKTPDSGISWTDLSGSFSAAAEHRQIFTYPPPDAIPNPFKITPAASFQEFTADPNNFSVLYIGSGDGLFRSRTGGFSWERMNILIPPEALPVNSAAVRPGNPQIIFAAASNQLHYSGDGGVNWSVKTIPADKKIIKILIHPLRPDTMFMFLGG